MILNIILFMLAFFFMEFVAWSNHKYIMHGFLWRWHKDHHINDLKRPDEALQEEKGLEKNDLFFLVYALPAIALMILGFSLENSQMIALALGITLYGFTYFVLHDVIYHYRLPMRFLQRSKNRYIKALVKAHRAHHKPRDAVDFESYGLLFFSKRFFKE